MSNLTSFFFKIKDTKFEKCLAPKEKCENAAIRAHTVQNSRILELLSSKDNHLIGFKLKCFADKAPIFIYDKVPRDEATTFKGLCSLHDAKLFKPIDTQKIDLNNKEHCYLFAYRAVIRELHSTIESTRKFQSAYLEIEKPDQNKNALIGTAGTIATENLMNSYEIYKYKIKYDFIYEYKLYEYINHFSIAFDMQRPTIAVSSMFLVNDINNDEGEPLRIVLNIFPLSHEKTIVLFSWLSHENEAAKLKLINILSSEGDYRKYLVSKLVLRYCENLVISPEYFLSWSDRKKYIVKQFFEKNTGKEWEFDDTDVFLF